MQYITGQNNCKIAVSVEGRGEPLLFLHGWPTNQQLWACQRNRLKAYYKVITFDWPGFGKSDKPEARHYTFTAQKEILNSVVDACLEKHEKVNLVAHDIGGPPAILWANQYPDRVKKLVLLNTIIYPFKTFLHKISHITFRIPVLSHLQTSRPGLALLMQFLSRNREKRTTQTINQILRWQGRTSTRVKVKTVLEPVNSGKNSELQMLTKYFKKLNCEKYLIIARKDPLCYKHMQQLQAENSHTEAFYVANSGHFIPVDQPEKLYELLALVLAKVPTAL